MQINLNESDIAQPGNVSSSGSVYDSTFSLSNGRTNTSTISSRQETQSVPVKSKLSLINYLLDTIEAKTKLFGK